MLGRSWAYGHWLQTEAAAKPAIITDVDADAVNTVLAGAIAAGQPLLDVDDTLSVLTSYGIAMPPTLFVAADDSVAAAEELGYPVAVKARHRHVGRSLKAGVALDLTDTADVVDSVRVMREELGEHADAMVVQAMTAPGVDLRIRASLDERLGPLVAIGVGGFGSDLLADEKVRLAPLSAESAHALISESRAGAALQQAEIGTGLLVDTLIRAAQLAADHPEFVDIDLNPVTPPATRAASQTRSSESRPSIAPKARSAASDRAQPPQRPQRALRTANRCLAPSTGERTSPAGDV